MTRTLLLAYFFPPIGGAGSQRSLKLARYLPESGVEVTVVSGMGSSVGRWSPRDETLSRELPSTVDVRRVRAPEPAGSNGWRRQAEKWLTITDPWSRWWVDEVVKEAASVAPEIDVVVASMSPYASAVAAARINATTGLPWVADLRDPWALDEMMIHPTSLHRRHELARMQRLLATAAAIVTTTPEAVNLIRRHMPELGAKPVISITNGFDASDFADAPTPRTDNVLRIAHTGYLHTDTGTRQRQLSAIRTFVGGGRRGVEIMTRSHVYLLEAIARLIERDETYASRIEVHLAGVLSEEDRELAERLPFIRLHGYLTHADAIALMQSSDLLFLPMQKMAPGERSSIIPGKTFEYLAARRRILAAVPEGDARDILVESGVALICEPDDVEAIASAIQGEATRRDGGEPTPQAEEAFIGQYERRVLARRYAELLADCVAR